jgi:peroxiredoxin
MIRWEDRLRLTELLLSDPAKDAARAYGVLSPTGYASRWTFSSAWTAASSGSTGV